MSNITFECGGQVLAERYHTQICRLYDAVFSSPPFAWLAESSRAYSERLAQIRENPTFGLSLATQDGRLIGFAYGHGLPVDHEWWRGFPTPLPEDLVYEWDDRTFALIDFTVDEAWRCQGVGKRLLEYLLQGRREERALLSVQPGAQARRIYYRLGWLPLGRRGPVEGAETPYQDVFIRDL